MAAIEKQFKGKKKAVEANVQAIDKGRFGRIWMANCTVRWTRPQEYYDSGAWRGTWKFDGGGALMNQGIHTVDLLLWLLGAVVVTLASGREIRGEIFDVADWDRSLVINTPGQSGQPGSRFYGNLLRDWADNGAASRWALSPDQVVDASRPRPREHAEAAAAFEIAQQRFALDIDDSLIGRDPSVGRAADVNKKRNSDVPFCVTVGLIHRLLH